MARFSVRARAVDMLGRQQIAGIPTAIHELFKNAHDAYATRVEVDFIRSQNRLVIRDNGLGMTEEDFTNRWLTLGTESKFGKNAETLAKWTGPEALPIRPLMGEKGIGRLAIATVAPVTFVLSRAVRESEGLFDLTACLVCWRLFELPGVDISAIDIPLQTFRQLPTAADVEQMVDEVKENVEQIVPDSDVRAEIFATLNRCHFDPEEFDNWFSSVATEVDEKNLSLSGQNYGTHFFLFDCDESLANDLRSDEVGEKAAPIKQMLLGFGNTMSPEYTPPIRAEFRDHNVDGNFNELIGEDEFFSSDDLELGDHFFEGEFDEYGQFNGTLRIYRGAPEEYVLSWPEAKGNPTACGPFKIRLGVIQGLTHESVLDPELHRKLDQKMRRLGGLYVYRDGIRILPYGKPEFDWLGIEHRRTMSASDWFFSHRRMAGYIDLNRIDNAGLSEKAGREGFRQNRAYRDLQAILENWLMQVAKDFFRKTSERSPRYREVIETKRREVELLRKRKAKSGQLKAEFRELLNQRHDEIDTGTHERSVENAVENARSRLENLRVEALKKSGPLVGSLGLESLDIEDKAVADLERKSQALHIPRPRQFSPTKSDISAYEAYLAWLDSFEETVLEPAVNEIRSQGSEIRLRLGVRVSKSERVRSAINAEMQRLQREVTSLHRNISRNAEELNSVFKTISQKKLDDFLNRIEGFKAELHRQDFDALDESTVLNKQRKLERDIDSLFGDVSAEMNVLLHQVRAIQESALDDSLPAETMAALESRINDLEEQLSFYNDLAQAGSAISIIGHELENVISGLRGSIRDIKPWADGTPELGNVYERLRTYYDHLDSYVGLFSPLSRRVRRSRTSVSGESILSYIRELFGERLEQAGISLNATDEFKEKQIVTYRSTLISAVVNIVDNAIYWITSDKYSERWISFIAQGNGIAIKNGGPGISRRVSKSIFELGVSNKPSGRGMGLAVSKEALESVGLKLRLLTEGTETHPAFLIEPDMDEVNNDE